MHTDFKKDKKLYVILYNRQPYRLINQLFLKEKKDKTVFYRWMMKDLESQSTILLKDKMIVSISKSQNISKLLVIMKYWN